MNTNDIRIDLPGSKSISNRLVLMDYLFGHTLHINNLSHSDDTSLLKSLLHQLDCHTSDIYNCHNAGTVARFLMPLLAIRTGNHILTGDERLCQRPMQPLIEALRQIGLNIQCLKEEGFLPVSIKGGTPTRRTLTIDPTLSSQFVSAMLIIATQMPEGLSITMTSRPASRPYIEMTQQLLQYLGADIRLSSNGRTYYVQPMNKSVRYQNITVENDWSAAANFYTMALIRPDIRLRFVGLSTESIQGDRVCADFFSHLGMISQKVSSPYRKNTNSLTIRYVQTESKGFQYNCKDCPDLMPSFAVAAAVAGVKVTLKGISNNSLKESDRITAVCNELEHVGVRTRHKDDLLTIYPSKMHTAESIETYCDHRIAMAFAPLTLIYKDMVIKNREVVNKSFPTFWEEFYKVQCAD